VEHFARVGEADFLVEDIILFVGREVQNEQLSCVDDGVLLIQFVRE
jgi:hypothetical protein